MCIALAPYFHPTHSSSNYFPKPLNRKVNIESNAMHRWKVWPAFLEGFNFNYARRLLAYI